MSDNPWKDVRDARLGRRRNRRIEREKDWLRFELFLMLLRGEVRIMGDLVCCPPLAEMEDRLW